MPVTNWTIQKRIRRITAEFTENEAALQIRNFQLLGNRIPFVLCIFSAFSGINLRIPDFRNGVPQSVASSMEN